MAVHARHNLVMLSHWVVNIIAVTLETLSSQSREPNPEVVYCLIKWGLGNSIESDRSLLTVLPLFPRIGAVAVQTHLINYLAYYIFATGYF